MDDHHDPEEYESAPGGITSTSDGVPETTTASVAIDPADSPPANKTSEQASFTWFQLRGFYKQICRCSFVFW